MLCHTGVGAHHHWAVPSVREKLISLSALSVMAAAYRTALSILGGGGGSDGPPGTEAGGDRLPINLALPWLCTVCVLLDRRGGPAPCGAHQHPHREGPKAPPASAKQISYYHMVQGG